MATLNAKQVLSDLYGLMMEINYHRPDEDVLEELQQKPDAQLEKHLVKIRQISAKLMAQANKERFQKAIEQIRILKDKGLDELKKLISPHEQAQLVPLFRKFEELTEKDEAAIMEDQELLHLIEVLKNKIDEDTE
jgi:hypothetical protein